MGGWSLDGGCVFLGGWWGQCSVLQIRHMGKHIQGFRASVPIINSKINGIIKLINPCVPIQPAFEA